MILKFKVINLEWQKVSLFSPFLNAGNMAAFDMNDPNAVVSPGGVGFDINCGVRLVRTNLDEKDVAPRKEQLAQVSSVLCLLKIIVEHRLSRNLRRVCH